jgi:site-specific DNA-methyltransferase (adenine-specific)
LDLNISIAKELPGKLAWNSHDKSSFFIQGDCFEIMSSIPENSIDCIWTDPPYFLSNDGVTCVGGKMVKVNKGEWDKSRGLELDHEFNKGWIDHCHRILKPAGTIWISGTLHVYLSVGMALLQSGFRILNDIIWEKPNPPPNLGIRCFTHSTEMILWATKAHRKSKDKYTFHYQHMKQEAGGKQMKNVWKMKAPSKTEKQFGKHPTQKPIELIARCLRASTNSGDLVFDPFSGSGSTGVAAQLIGRKFLGSEINKEFTKLAIKRLSDVDGSASNSLIELANPIKTNPTLFD